MLGAFTIRASSPNQLLALFWNLDMRAVTFPYTSLIVLSKYRLPIVTISLDRRHAFLHGNPFAKGTRLSI
jgi:hypothetical protein